jgi:curved DNA-binding protein CbpA
MERVHTYYDNLKIVRTAPTEVIRAAYRAMAQKYHPDLNPAPDAARVMKLVNEAWEVLSDPKRRAEHDIWIASQEQSTQEQTSQGRSQQYTNSSGGSGFTYQQPNATHAKKESDGPSGYKGQSKKAGSSGASSFSGTHPFQDATEGYKASTPNWVRRFKAIGARVRAILSIKNDAVPAASLVWLLALGSLIAILVFPVVYQWKSVTKPPVQYRSTGDVNAQEPRDEVGAAQSQPRTFKFDEATATPVDVSPKFVPYDGPVIPLEQRPKNGYLKGVKILLNRGLSSFTVDNTRGSVDAEVGLYAANIRVRSFYVRQGTSFTAEKLSPTDYRMRYKIVTAGKAHVYLARDVFSLSETPTETGTRFSRVTVSLYTVKDGNMHTDEVPEDQF